MKKVNKISNTEDMKLSECFKLTDNEKSNFFNHPLLACLIIKTSAVALTALLIYIIILK